jgi:hypothetical protein
VTRISLRPLLATRADTHRFVGRSEETERLLTNLDEGINTLVLSERGGGLSSFLNLIVYRTEERDDRRVVLLPGEAARSASDLLAAVADRLAAASSPDGEVPPTPDRPEYSTDDSAVLLWRLDRLTRAAASHPSPAIVVIDGIANGEIAHTVFGQLRNELWRIPQITWVLGGAASQRGRYLEPPAEAFWESVIELGPLSDKQLGLLLLDRRLTGLARSTLENVIEGATGNPSKVLLLARIARDGELPGETALDPELGEAATRLIHYLGTNGPASASDKGLLSALGWSRGRAQQVFKVLEDAGLAQARPESTDGTPGRPRKVYELIHGAS